MDHRRQANFDLQSVVTHEFGHALGLGHTPDRGAVMAADYPQGAIKRDLTGDDVDGLSGLYGRAPAPPLAEPANHALALSSGPNLLTWPGGDTNIVQALGDSLGSVRAIYAYDEVHHAWVHYFPGGPPYLNTLDAIEHNTAYWLISDRATSLVLPAS
jgi:hypothetical protein